MQLRNTAIISIAAFYLLLTTGMFVCIVHCAGDYLLDKAKITHLHQGQSPEKENAHDKKEKDCKGDKDCSCCNQHGSYTVTENISVSFNSKIPAVTELITHPCYQLTVHYKLISSGGAWPEIHDPPAISGKDISIKFRSLLI